MEFSTGERYSDVPISSIQSVPRVAGNELWDPLSQETGKKDQHIYSHPVLFVLRLISFKAIAMFPFDPGSSWSKRSSLGHGSVHAVEEEFIPQWRELHVPYRDPTLLEQRKRSYFIDHRGLKWARDTPVAYKLPYYDTPRDRSGQTILQGLTIEMSILSHPSIESHPNVVRLLGVAWVNEEDMNLYATKEEEPESDQAAWPIAVIEKAAEGSLKDLFRVRRSQDHQTPIPLVTKFGLCIDVLRALQVGTKPVIIIPIYPTNS